jgi:hypothetical protein
LLITIQSKGTGGFKKWEKMEINPFFPRAKIWIIQKKLLTGRAPI